MPSWRWSEAPCLGASHDGGAACGLTARPCRSVTSNRMGGRKRQAWWSSRSWSCVTHRELLSVIGVVQYGTSRVVYRIVTRRSFGTICIT